MNTTFRIRKKLIMPYLVIIDILFLPYFDLLKTSYSSIIILILVILNLNSIFTKENVEIWIMIILSVFSFIISFLEFPQYAQDNLVKLTIFVLFLIYYLFFDKFRNVVKKIHIKKLLYIFLLFNFILCIVYLLNYETYFFIRGFWALSPNNVTIQELSILTRFAGIVSDSNNCAAVLIAVASFLCISSKKDERWKIHIMVTVCVLATMSVTGIVCLIIYYLYFIVEKFKVRKIRKRNIILASCFVIFAIVTIGCFFSSIYGELLLERIQLNLSIGGEGGRVGIWEYILSNDNIFSHIIWGYGGNIIIGNSPVSPHSGHIYLIYNFGMIVYILFIKNFFKIEKIKRNYIFYIVFFLNFSMNTVLIDYRATMIYFILLIFSSEEISRLELRRNDERLFIKKK